MLFQKSKMKLNVQIIKSWRLNERSYGKLEGQNKDYVKSNFKSEYHKFRNCVYTKPYISAFSSIENTTSESINDTALRFKPLWYNIIIPLLKRNKNVLIVSHKNQIKSILLLLNLDHKKEIKNCEPIYLRCKFN